MSGRVEGQGSWLPERVPGFSNLRRQRRVVWPISGVQERGEGRCHDLAEKVARSASGSLETWKPLEFNDQAAELMGYSRDEFASLTINDLEQAPNPKETTQHIAEILEAGGDVFEARHKARRLSQNGLFS